MGWLYDNLENDADMGGYGWGTAFSMAVWWSWKWRCWNIFGNNGKCWDRVKFIKNLAIEVTMAHAKSRDTPPVGDRVEKRIVWSPPVSAWLKMNTDRASWGNPGLAAAGGILGDENRIWVCGFALNVGVCSAPLAEL